MKLSLEFQTKLKNTNKSFSKEELEDGLRLLMVDFIEKNIEIYQLLKISEQIRKDYRKQLSKKFLETVNKLHNLNKDLHNSKKEQLNEEQITFLIDDLLNFLMD